MQGAERDKDVKRETGIHVNSPSGTFPGGLSFIKLSNYETAQPTD